MLAASAFRKLCGYFHQDIGLDNASPEEWIAFARRHLDRSERNAARQYVDGLLSEAHSAAELQRVWFDSGAEVYFPDEGDLRKFLRLTRDMLA